jgi:hypothetical protein
MQILVWNYCIDIQQYLSVDAVAGGDESASSQRGNVISA